MEQAHLDNKKIALSLSRLKSDLNPIKESHLEEDEEEEVELTHSKSSSSLVSRDDVSKRNKVRFLERV